MIGKHLFKRHPLALTVLAALNLAPAAHAAVGLSTPYTQDFNTLINSGSATFTNDSTINGWYSARTGTGATIVANTGSSTAGALYSYGAATIAERAIGSVGSGNATAGSFFYGVRFVNDTANTITALNITYTGEQWRNSAAVSQTVDFGYQIGATSLMTGTWIDINSLDFISPVTGGAAGALDGNAATNRTTISNSIPNLSLAPGQEIWLRWSDIDHAGSDHGLAIDDLSVTPAFSASTPTINLSVSSNAGSEAGTTVITVTASASTTVASDQTVNLGVTGAGITVGDYTLSNTAITIPSGSATGTVTFTVIDDALTEGTETATLAISAPSAGITLGATTTQNITITDNDVASNPTVNLSVSSSAASEASPAAITVTATTSSAVTGSQSVNLAVGGTGITVGDYSLSATTITIPDNSTTGSVTFTVVDDTLVEGTETAALAISTPSAGIALGATTAQNIVIADNDIDPGTACGDSATKISAVQGSGVSTLLSGSTTIEGIVVGDYQGLSTNSLRGFFVQEEDADADGNPATSEGVFVFEGASPLAAVNVGDKVRVTGTPGEAFESTQLSASSVQVCALNQTIPTAASLTLPVPNVPNDNLANATAAVNAYYEPFEGMLVKFPTTLKVSEYFELERFGQLVLSQGGRIPTFTSVSNPSATGLINQQITLAKRQIVLDDGIDTSNFYITPYAVSNNIPLPYPTGGLSTGNIFRGGDTISNLTGVLQYAFTQWRVRPVEELVDYTFTKANPRKPVSPVVDGTLKVASFNVLNYFTTIDTTSSSTSGSCGPDSTQDCRGADSAVELARQTAKAATALCGINADILGLMEIENNATASLNSLVTAANAINGCGPYAFINTGTIGTDAIKVALVYKPSTVSPVGSHKLLTTSVDARFIDTKNRPTLAQTFSQTVGGEKLTVAVNHLKSKGSACTGDADLNDGQGNCNLTRKDAAMAMVDWLNTDPTNSGDPDFLIIGDLNSYAKEDPIKAIEMGPDDIANSADDYTNLVKAFGGDAAYSYVFDGQTGYLDHALASNTLLPQVTGTADWHINSDEAPSMDYNDTIKDAGEAAFEAKPAALPLYAANQYRTSDHDPVIIGLQLGETINIIEGTSAKNVLNGTAAKDRITGLGSADTLTGGLNADEFVYIATADGIDTITDFTLGADKIVLTALLQSLGYQGANPLTDGIVKFAVSGANTLVYIDADGAGPAVQRALIVVNNVSAVNLNNAANFIF